MNKSETRAEHIDPALAAAGWGVVEGSRIAREYRRAAVKGTGCGLWLVFLTVLIVSFYFFEMLLEFAKSALMEAV